MEFWYKMASAGVLPYELYSPAPGTLFNKPEWERANGAHPEGTDFGEVPQGWPKKIEGPLVWDGKDLEAHPEKFILFLNTEDIAEVDAALKVYSKMQRKYKARLTTLNLVLSRTFTSSICSN